MSLWAWTLDPRLAAALAVVGGFSGQLLAALTVRRGFDPRRLAPFLLGGLAGVPLGVWLLPRLDVAQFKTVLGATLVIVCPLMILVDRLPRVTHGGRIADAVSGGVGGLMGGIGGFSGVVPSLWCTLRGYPKDTQRSVVQNFNLAMLAVTFATYLATGIVRESHASMLALVVPAMVLPSLLGARLYRRLGDKDYRQLVLALLTASGVALLAAGLPALVMR
ncbi:sulfite exporter TauE/SafE family protein [Ramlibacter solisilvae]